MPDERDAEGRRIFVPDGPVLEEYLFDRSHVSIIRGPIGSGTSSTSCYKIAAIAAEMPKWRDGVRRSRWGVVRNTYPELKDTTLKTWLEWFPEEVYGPVNRARPMSQMMRWADVEAEIYFLALDDEGDIKKLRSLEITGFWFNEVEYILKPLFDEAESRTGRFPPKREIGEANPWRGVFADLNAPGEEHWLPMMTGEVPYPDDVPEEKRTALPDDWTYFVQPPALIEQKDADGKIIGYEENAEAENRRNLQDGYYQEKAKGKSKAWIDSRLMNRIVTVMEGDPVWKNFNPEVHLTSRPLEYNPAYPVYVSLDFGQRPCALIGQEINQRVCCQRELRDYGTGAASFAPRVKQFLAENYPGARLHVTGDPKGQDKVQSGERTAYDIFAAHGLKITPCPVKANALEPRLEVVRYALDRSPNGNSRILISRTGCPTLTAAMSGKYHLTKLDSGEAVPVKDKWSDPPDCLGYMLIYIGEGRQMIGMTSARRPGVIRPKNRPLNLRRVV